MIEIEGETYLLATEAAKHLKISRSKFYNDYHCLLNPLKVGQLKWKRYRISELNRIQVIQVETEKAS